MPYICEVLLESCDLTSYLVNNRYRVHELLRTIVPKPSPHPLWRLDYGARSRLIVQSGVPVSEWLVEHYLEIIGQVRQKFTDFNIEKGRYRFQLEATPTISPKCQNRRPIDDEAGRKEWLVRKLADVGEVRIENVVPCTVVKFEKPNKRLKGAKRDITLTSIRYTGTIDVQHPDSLRALLEKGVGPSKSFGCGLLNIANDT